METQNIQIQTVQSTHIIRYCSGVQKTVKHLPGRRTFIVSVKETSLFDNPDKVVTLPPQETFMAGTGAPSQQAPLAIWWVPVSLPAHPTLTVRPGFLTDSTLGLLQQCPGCLIPWSHLFTGHLHWNNSSWCFQGESQPKNSRAFVPSQSHHSKVSSPLLLSSCHVSECPITRLNHRSLSTLLCKVQGLLPQAAPPRAPWAAWTSAAQAATSTNCIPQQYP